MGDKLLLVAAYSLATIIYTLIVVPFILVCLIFVIIVYASQAYMFTLNIIKDLLGLDNNL